LTMSLIPREFFDSDWGCSGLQMGHLELSGPRKCPTG
jgi:hypothetical protein